KPPPLLAERTPSQVRDCLYPWERRTMELAHRMGLVRCTVSCGAMLAQASGTSHAGRTRGGSRHAPDHCGPKPHGLQRARSPMLSSVGQSHRDTTHGMGNRAAEVELLPHLSLLAGYLSGPGSSFVAGRST